jgi:hypothetical protein
MYNIVCTCIDHTFGGQRGSPQHASVRQLPGIAVPTARQVALRDDGKGSYKPRRCTKTYGASDSEKRKDRKRRKCF